MLPMIVLSLLLALGGAVLVAMALRIRRVDPVRALAAEFDALDAARPGDGYREQLEEPLLTRLFAPLTRAIEDLAKKVMPAQALEQAREQLVTAGLTSRITAEEFITFRLLAAIGGVAFAGVFLTTIGGLQGGAAAALSVAVGLMAPKAVVERARQERVAAVERSLPDALDLLAISVEAGLGFEQALAVVVDRGESVLSQEFGHTLREMQLGRSRVEALHELRRRVSVPDLNSLVLSLVQADALGMPLSRILRSQAAELRRRRRQRVREAAAKLPLKMLFPLVLFILPTLFVVVLVPALISLFNIL